jgi:hypothetical protein
MARIPLSNRTQSPQVVRQPRGDVGGAGRGWNAVAQAGQVLGQVGSQIAQSNAKNKAFDERLAAEKDKADIARGKNEYDNDWGALQESLAEIKDPLQIKVTLDEWLPEQKKRYGAEGLSRKAQTELETKFLDIQAKSTLAVTGSNGYMKSATTKIIDRVWIDQEQDAINTGDEEKHTEAVEARRSIGTMNDEEVARAKTKFGQEVYERASLHGIHRNYQETLDNINFNKMSVLGGQNFRDATAEVKSKIKTSKGNIQDHAIKAMNKELKVRGVSLVDLNKQRSERVEAYAGEMISPLTEDAYNFGYATVMDQVLLDKDTSQWGGAYELMAKMKKKGIAHEADLDDVLRMMTKNKEARFTVQTNINLIDDMETLFDVGNRFNPTGYGPGKHKFDVNRLHGEAMSTLIDSYKKKIAYDPADDSAVFTAFRSSMKSLMTAFQGAGKDWNQDTFDAWRKVSMKDIDDEHAQEAVRATVSSAGFTGPRNQPDDIRAMLNANPSMTEDEAKEYLTKIGR